MKPLIAALVALSTALGPLAPSVAAQDAHPEARITELDLEIPEQSTPIANYVRAVRVGDLLYLGGHANCEEPYETGKVGRDRTVEQGYEAARLTALCLLATLKAELGDLGRVRRIVRVFGIVNATDDFTQHSQVINGASDLLVDVFGERGRHARAAIGASSLPIGLTVEIEMIVEVEGTEIGGVQNEVPPLPDGAQTSWIVDEPVEIVGNLTFDPESVTDRLPDFLRFLTLGDLVARGNEGATALLDAHPERAAWGVSFVEIVRQETFEIDGRAPDLGEDGAVGLWVAGVVPASAENEHDAEAGRLVLDLWMPDSAYVEYMRTRGHYAAFGEVRLREDSDGAWHGSIELPNLRATVTCVPTGEPREMGSAVNVVYPPATFSFRGLLRVAYAGHKLKKCEGPAAWSFDGRHPLGSTASGGPPTFQYGFDLVGGAYQGDEEQADTP